MNTNLDKIPTAALAAELARRADLVKPDGLLSRDLFELRASLGSIVCVDGTVIVDDKALAIIRNTGPYKGKICLIGGVIAKHEPISDSVKRQFKKDVGLDVELVSPWEAPFMVTQFRRPDVLVPEGDFLPDPTKDHAISLVYIVRIVGGEISFGTTEHGGREAANTVWISKEDFPADDEFGYGHEAVFKRVLEVE